QDDLRDAVRNGPVGEVLAFPGGENRGVRDLEARLGCRLRDGEDDQGREDLQDRDVIADREDDQREDESHDRGKAAPDQEDLPHERPRPARPRRITDKSVVEPEDPDRRRQGRKAHNRPGDPDCVRAEQPRGEAPEDEAEDGAPDAPGEDPTALLADEGRLGDPFGREDGPHPGEFPALDDAHERRQRGRANKDYRTRGRAPISFVEGGAGARSVRSRASAWPYSSTGTRRSQRPRRSQRARSTGGTRSSQRAGTRSTADGS